MDVSHNSIIFTDVLLTLYQQNTDKDIWITGTNSVSQNQKFTHSHAEHYGGVLSLQKNKLIYTVYPDVQIIVSIKCQVKDLSTSTSEKVFK